MANDLVVVLAGARGAAGRMHARIHHRLGNRLVEFDVTDPPPSAATLRRIPWDEALMDICTPTAAHAQSMSWGYARGVRRFLVEKPAAASLVAWQRQLATMPAAQIFVLHPYLYSRSFQIALDAVPAVSELETTFDKDRASDDSLGRGAGPDGRLPHLFQVEAPHQFAMALAALPGLRVVSAVVDGRADRGTEPDAAVAGRVRLHDAQVCRVLLATSLRAPRRRTLRVANRAGDSAVAEFPTNGDLVGRVWQQRRGRLELLFEGVDDLLRNTIATAVERLQQGTVPLEASPRFAGTVLARIDEAIALAGWPSPALEVRPVIAAWTDEPDPLRPRAISTSADVSDALAAPVSQ